MAEFLTLEIIDEVTREIQKQIRFQPDVGLVLGTGLGELAEELDDADIIPYTELPHWPKSTVMGHKGRLVIGKLAGVNVLIQQGRAHYYEGYSMAQVTLPVRVMNRLGIKTFIVTNAAGAINPDYVPGDIMLITDHISLIGMTGPNPLRGPNLDAFGERFPDMSQCYNRRVMSLAREAARKHQLTLHEGVYCSLSGPSFETPADLRFLKIIGADAVGMSTVPEVIVARHGKMDVLGLSGISNKANLDGNTITTHEEVLEAGKVIVPKLKTIILETLKNL